MNKYKYVDRFLSNFYNYIFPVILGLILLSIYFIFFEPVSLCDGDSLYDLQVRMAKEVDNYYIAKSNVNFYTVLYDKLIEDSSPRWSNFSLENTYLDKISYHRHIKRACYNNVCDLSNRIIQIQS
jgi:hypothetical protein